MIKRTIIITISLGIFFVDKIIYAMLTLFGYKLRSRLIVIYYHSIPKRDISSFWRQMNCLRHHTKPVSSLNIDIKPYNSLYSLLTFDDAFNSILKYAMPILEVINIPFIIFLPTKYLGKIPLWVKDIHKSGLKDEMVLNASEIYNLSLKSNLVTIGSHTVSHPRLTKCSDFELSTELINSKRKIEDITGRPCAYLSFPYGDYNKIVVHAAKRAEYQNCFSIDPSLHSYPANNFVVGRTEVSPTDSIIEFFLKIKGAYRWLPHAYKIKECLNNLNRG